MVITIFMPFLFFHRTYEMELRLNDPKSKENDMGVILVDVCLMFRDATIKRSPVSVFMTWKVFFLWLYSSLNCADSHFFSTEMATKEEQGMYFSIIKFTF